MKRSITGVVIAIGVATASIVQLLPNACFAAATGKSTGTTKTVASKDKVVEIVVGPFDLHRRYRSMEGPYVSKQIRIADLLASKSVQLPESMVTFVEGNTSGSGPSMGGPGASTSAGGLKPLGLVDASEQPRELYWFKGMKIQVLDENDKPLPTAEFICHLNLDIDPAFRNKVFPEGERCHNGRLITLTQGQTNISFPEGFGVPVASDELWTWTFQAANRTTDVHRRLKHRCLMYFSKDSDLMYPIKALSWYAPYISVVVDRDSPEATAQEHHNSPDCLGTSVGVTAPNSVPGALISDTLKRKLSGHWVVPPGTHTYTTPIIEERDPGFTSQDRMVHFVWSHIHPLCSSVSLSQCGSQQPILTVHAKTNVDNGLELENIEVISSKSGIKIPAGQHYEMTATYDNVTDSPQDSMVVLGVFFADNTFARPNWFLCNKNEAFCGVTAPRLELGKTGVSLVMAEAQQPAPAPKSPTDYLPPYPLFDSQTDGPLLTGAKIIELDTSAGKLHLELDPSIAPIHATQMYKLFKNGLFNGTPIHRYEPAFVLQASSVESKVSGQPGLTSEMKNMLRRLPLEVNSAVVHQKWMLSMARYDDNNSAVSSFSIMLGNAPHLDQKYTLFGHLVPDQVTTQTVDRIIQDWSKGQPYIVDCKELSMPVANK